MNNLIMNNQNANARNYVLRAICLSVVGLLLTVFTMQVKAGYVFTSIEMGEPGTEITTGRVTIFDADSGRQIANGVNYNNRFFFTSTPGPIIVVVMTQNGYIGSKRGSAGQYIWVRADQLVATMPFVHADANGDANLTYTDVNGAPVKKAIVTTTEWASFGNARRGKTDALGQYFFKDPKDLAGSDFLAVEWKGSGAISLKAIVTGDHILPGEDDEEEEGLIQ